MNSSQPGKDPTERTGAVPLITLTPVVSESKRQKTAETLLNVLQGKIANPNTRSAYKTAWCEFFVFCSEYKLELDLIKPFHFGLWQKWQEAGIKDKRNTVATKPHGVATQRQHLAAIRLLFDHLLEVGLVNLNPAARASAPRLKRETSHTPVFELEEIKFFLERIESDSLIGIRDKALFTTLAYTWARVSAVTRLNVEDYYERKGDRWIRLSEKRGVVHEVPVHSLARLAIDVWLSKSGIDSNPSMPLFPAFAQDKKTILSRHMHRTNIWRLVQARARAAGLNKRVGCHSFRATGLTEYMNAGGALETAQRIAGHSQLSTTKIYDRSRDRLTLSEIERVSFHDQYTTSSEA